MKAVPIEPTREMIAAGTAAVESGIDTTQDSEQSYEVYDACDLANRAYRAMIDAAPTGTSSGWTTSVAEPGEYYWVSDLKSVWLAKSDPKAAGGWTNDDTWEDFDRAVKCWIKVPRPANPQKLGRPGES